jgi:uncharacterized protein YecE (DUF72 family)
MPAPEQVIAWKNKTPACFRFFPKIPGTISHYKRLKDVQSQVDQFCHAICMFEEKLGMVFLQLHDNFKPKDFDRLQKFIMDFPRGIPLAVEVRSKDWFGEPAVAEEYFQLLEENNVTNIIVDTAGRRDLLHMRLTTPSAFIRYVGANHSSDFSRLDTWLERIVIWKKEGLQNLNFFVHQNIEEASPLLSAYFIKKLNNLTDQHLIVPQSAHEKD